MIRTIDDAGTRQRNAFSRVRRVEIQYGIRLRTLAQYISDVIRHYGTDSVTAAVYIRDALSKYAQAIEPWAKAVSSRMIAEAAARDRMAWFEAAKLMNRQLVKEIDTTPLGDRLRTLMDQQVGLIKSIPLEAADQVHELVIKGLEGGERPADIAKHIEGVTRSRATLIANTESGRVATALVELRAEHLGIEEFVWASMRDSAVRYDHKILDGHVFRFDDPPVADQRTGIRALPGCIWRCRCFCDVTPFLPNLKNNGR